ncbi:hypothetical protein ACEPAF_584 [Sanghuangporus sanghuang]
MASAALKEAPEAFELSPRSNNSDSPVKSQSSKLKFHDPHDQSAATLHGDSHDHDDFVKVAAHDSLSDSVTVSSDEFDWDAEDDGASKRDLETKRKTRRGRKIYGLFMKLSRSFRTFLVAILGAGIFIAPYLIFHFRFHDSPARPHVHAWSLWFSITWAAGSGTYLIVDLIPRFIIFIVTLFHGQVENLKSQIELVYAVSGWLKLCLDVSWSWIALSVIRATLHPPGSYWVIINRVMQALFASSIILLAEKTFLRFVAIRFHQKALADRLAENKLALKALDRLSNAQPVATKRSPYILNRRKGHKGSAAGSQSPSMDVINKELGIDGGAPSEGAATDSAGRVKRTQMGRKRRRKAVGAMIVDQLGDAIGQVALKDSKFNRASELTGLHSAKKLAKQLFSTLSNVHPPRKYLIVEDFEPYFHSKAEAAAAFSVFDKDNNGDITKKEMREAVQRIYRERKALVASLKDVGSIVAKLDAVLVCVALLGIIFCCLLIFNRDNTVQSLVPMATIVLGFSFIFGNSAQTLFESLIFIFSTHVFDVGDLVMIDDNPLFVKEFGLFSTTFRRVDGLEIIAPNSLLANTKLVHNLRRSNSMWETTNLQVGYDTALELIEALQSRLKAYVSQNNREWSNVNVNINKMEYQNAMTLVIAMEHRPNWQDWGGRWSRRTQFMRHLKTILEELDISYTLPVQPVVLPKAPPYSGGLLNVPSRFSQSRESLGNAGYHQDDFYRAPEGEFDIDSALSQAYCTGWRHLLFLHGLGSSFVALCRELRNIEPRPIRNESMCSSAGTFEPTSLKVFRRWVRAFRRQFPRPSSQTTTILFLFLFPDEDTRRKYGMREASLAKELINIFGTSDKEGGRGANLKRWSSPTSNSSSLGEQLCDLLSYSSVVSLVASKNVWVVHNIFWQSTNAVTQLSLHGVNKVLDDLASKSRFSATSLRPSCVGSFEKRRNILGDIYRKLGPFEAAILTQIILKDLRSILYPAKNISSPESLLRFNSTAVHMLTLQEAMHIWDPSNALLSCYKVQSTIEDYVGLFEGKQVSALRPEIGIPVQIPTCFKARGCRDALDKLKHSTSVWAETKYDGERMQIHVSPNECGESEITIFSKSRRDSTLDRIATHWIIREALRLDHDHPDACARARATTHHNVLLTVILEAEMIAYDRTYGVDGFWRIRELIESSATGARRRNKRERTTIESETSRHLALVFFDVLYLNGTALLSEPYCSRRATLEAIIDPIPMYAYLAHRTEIPLSGAKGFSRGLKILEHIFASSIADHEEGLVLKATDSTYADWRCPWVKLKKDYIPGFGDSVDLSLIGASWDKEEEELCASPLQLIRRSMSARSVPSPRRLSYGLDRSQLEELNFLIKSAGTMRTGVNDQLPFMFNLPGGLAEPRVILAKSLLVEVFGAGFTKSSETKNYELRFPRISKVHRSNDRSWLEAVTLPEFNDIALRAVGKSTPRLDEKNDHNISLQFPDIFESSGADKCATLESRPAPNSVCLDSNKSEERCERQANQSSAKVGKRRRVDENDCLTSNLDRKRSFCSPMGSKAHQNEGVRPFRPLTNYEQEMYHDTRILTVDNSIKRSFRILNDCEGLHPFAQLLSSAIIRLECCIRSQDLSYYDTSFVDQMWLEISHNKSKREFRSPLWYRLPFNIILVDLALLSDSFTTAFLMADVALPTIFGGALILVLLLFCFAYIATILLSPPPIKVVPTELKYRSAKSGAKFKDLPDITKSTASIDLSIVIPAFNEVPRLPSMLVTTIEHLAKPECSRRTYEILIVDDGSSDGTADLAVNLARKYSSTDIRVVSLHRNLGKGAAVRHGMLHSRGRRLLMADADGASRFEDLEMLWAEMNKMAPEDSPAVVVGSRAHLVDTEAVVKRSFLRNLAMHALHLTLRLIGVGHVRDTQCGFKLFSREAACAIFPYQHLTGWIFDVEILLLAKMKSIPVAEVPINWSEVPESKLRLMRDSLLMFRDLLVLRANHLTGRWAVPRKTKTQ